MCADKPFIPVLVSHLWIVVDAPITDVTVSRGKRSAIFRLLLFYMFCDGDLKQLCRSEVPDVVGLFNYCLRVCRMLASVCGHTSSQHVIVEQRIKK